MALTENLTQTVKDLISDPSIESRLELSSILLNAIVEKIHLDIIKLIVTSIKFHPYTILSLASMHGNLEVVNLLSGETLH